MTFQPTGMASLLFWGARPSCLQLSHACQEIAPNLSSDRAPAKTRKHSNKYTNTTKICVCVCIHYIYIYMEGGSFLNARKWSFFNAPRVISQRARAVTPCLNFVRSFCNVPWFYLSVPPVSGVLGFWVSWFLGFLVSGSLGFWVSWFLGLLVSVFLFLGILVYRFLAFLLLEFLVWVLNVTP